MTAIQFKILQADDLKTHQLIADWYADEWKIPIEKTIERLQEITNDRSQFQMLMYLNNDPIATGGLYHHIGLLDKEPRFKIYKNWLALVYTIPKERHQGYGQLLCMEIEKYSKKLAINTLYLFTDTAERLYQRMNWTVLERLSLSDRNIVVMKKE